MKKIWLFLLIIFILPNLAYSQKKCEEDYCPWLKTKEKVDNASIFLEPNFATRLNPQKIGLENLFYSSRPQNATDQKPYYHRFLLGSPKPKYSEWEFLRWWTLTGYVEYQFYGRWPIPSDFGFRLGKYIYFQWKK